MAAPKAYIFDPAVGGTRLPSSDTGAWDAHKQVTTLLKNQVSSQQHNQRLRLQHTRWMLTELLVSQRTVVITG